MEKRLYRSRNDRIVSGVCGGIAEYFGIDSIIVRLVWALAVVFGGTGLIVYLICMVIIPEEKKPIEDDGYAHYYEEDEDIDRKEHRTTVLGLLLILFGGFMLMRHFLPWIRMELMWPAILIFAGIYVIMKGRENNGR